MTDTSRHHQERGITLGVPTRDVTIDRLHCDRSKTHDVRMEWATSNGLRTGAMFAYCWTCQRPVAGAAPSPPTPAEMVAIRDEGRRTQAALRQDADARRETIQRAIALGEPQNAIAERMGITKQRVHQILSGRRPRPNAA